MTKFNSNPIFKMKIIAFILIACGLSTSLFAQKAYETINYSGKTQTFSLQLKYADGYLEASELTIKDLKSKKNNIFSLCDNGSEALEQRKFCLLDKKGNIQPDRYVVLIILEEAHAPEKIRGTYHYQNKTYDFVLSK